MSDSIFRFAILLGVALFAPAMVFFRVRSQLTGERLDRTQEGWFILVTLRLVALCGAVVMGAFLADPALVRWSSFSLPDWARWCGIIVGACSGLWTVWTMFHLGKNLTDTVVTRREHSLVTSGPYQWMRHPFYIGVTGTVVAASLATSNWLIALSGFIILFLLVLRTDREEAKLIERFGDDYRSYMVRTGRFWPRRPLPLP